LEKGIAYVEGNSTEADIKQSVEEIGYSYKGKI